MKRFLDALKAETFSRDVFPLFIQALVTLVKCNMTAEIFRSLALFITYAYHKPSNSASRTPKMQHGTLPSRISSKLSSGPKRPTINTLLDGSDTESAMLTKRELGNKVLEMYSGLLCENGSTANIRKFAKTVTNKACLPAAKIREFLLISAVAFASIDRR